MHDIWASNHAHIGITGTSEIPIVHTSDFAPASSDFAVNRSDDSLRKHRITEFYAQREDRITELFQEVL